MFCTVTNLSDSFATLVDSAEDGRKAELSFFWTSLSLPSIAAAEAAEQEGEGGQQHEGEQVLGRSGLVGWVGRSAGPGGSARLGRVLRHDGVLPLRSRPGAGSSMPHRSDTGSRPGRA